MYVVRGIDRVEGDRALVAGDCQAMRAQSLELPSPRDEEHVVARCCQLSAEVSADTAGSDHRNPHEKDNRLRGAAIPCDA
ncbi:hypothetical protein GCM10011492_21560 [Flexivirga endophytica]|uniref:Uncharacterized protein n=1 Tax=Flexivirga endophytica TaxID=1849103 RepID=A0A916T3R1_9MICO|nr:hypothetical protein GCM10011492_21560 [Flexivirga endophytica]GHB51671.1 hypothetical protein GCM10008112_20830 [Flexivirga endophytica]